MIRPTNRSLPFDFGPLLGPLAPPTDPPSNPPPPDNPFGGPDDPIKAQDPKDRIPFDGPIKRKPIKGGLLLPNDPVQAQNSKDKIQIEYARCSPDDFVVIVNGPYQDDGWYQREGTDPRPPFSSGIVFFVNWENRKRYFIPMLSLNPDTRGGFSFNGASGFGHLESIDFIANGKTYNIKVNGGPLRIRGNEVPEGDGNYLHFKYYTVTFEIVYNPLTGCTYIYITYEIFIGYP